MSEIKHYGVKGMKWGVRKSESSSPTPSGSSSAISRISVPLSTAHKRIVTVTVGTGAAVATTMMAGPIGGMAVSAVTRAVDISLASKGQAEKKQEN